MLPRIEIDKEKCQGLKCRLCLEVCPNRVLAVVGKVPAQKGRVRSRDQFVVEEQRPQFCTVCLDCVAVCPEHCIRISRDGGNA